MEEIIQILMNRDGLSRSEAKDVVKECRRRLSEEALDTGDYETAVEIIEEELGLEPDYMMVLLIGL